MWQPSSAIAIGMAFVSAIEIGFPDQIFGPPRECRSADISVARLRAIMEGQSGVPPPPLSVEWELEWPVFLLGGGMG